MKLRRRFPGCCDYGAEAATEHLVNGMEDFLAIPWIADEKVMLVSSDTSTPEWVGGTRGLNQKSSHGGRLTAEDWRLPSRLSIRGIVLSLSQSTAYGWYPKQDRTGHNPSDIRSDEPTAGCYRQ